MDEAGLEFAEAPAFCLLGLRCELPQLASSLSSLLSPFSLSLPFPYSQASSFYNGTLIVLW